MILIQENISLKEYNTFRCDAKANYFCTVSSTEALLECLRWADQHQQPFFILGGGSNILFTKNITGLVIKIEIKGIQKLSEQDQTVKLKVGAGENWHHFVLYTIEKGWCGIENLSLIPGTVGASPIQNIGAYGVEVKDVIHSVEVFDVLENTLKVIPRDKCQFGYRDSYFKKVKNRFIITNVYFELSKATTLHLEYGAIRDELHRLNIKSPSLKDVSNAIIQIRQSKLPDPKVIGNAGSFFKNPIVNHQKLESLIQLFPEIVSYPIDNNYYKIAAGWLIENAGFKGKNNGKVGTFDKQALVLINCNNATGQEVFDFSEEIIQTVQKKYDLTLEREVNIF